MSFDVDQPPIPPQEFVKHSFPDLAEAIRQSEVRLLCPGAECDIAEPEVLSNLAHKAVRTLTELPIYELGVVARRGVTRSELRQLAKEGRYKVPHPLCAAHFEYVGEEATLNEVFLLEDRGGKVAATIFYDTSVTPGWTLLGRSLIVDPKDFEADGAFPIAYDDVDGLAVEVTHPDDFDLAMEFQLEFLHQVVAALNSSVKMR
jgi:hypothetical protein